jgi:hypothetical protein
MPAFEKPLVAPAQPRAARAPAMSRADAPPQPGTARRPAPPQQPVLARLLGDAVARRTGGSVLSNGLQSAASAGSAVPMLGARRLQRLKKEHETQHLQLRYAIENIENYRSLLVATQTNWNDYHYQVYLQVELGKLVDPLIAELKAIYADVENEVTPDAKLLQAKKVIPKALKALDDLNAKGQPKDVTAVTEAYTKGKEALGKQYQKELSQRQAAAAADALLKQAAAAALAIQTQITATGIAPHDNGPAFDYPVGHNSADRRDKLHTWITLSWKPFRLLPRTALNNSKCFVYHLSKAQLEVLINRLGDEVVTEYAFQGWPTTRPPLAAAVDGLVMPVKLGSMTAYFGVELLIDWIVPNPGHTAQAQSLVDAFNFTANETKFTDFGGTVTSSPGRIRYQYNTGRRLITNQARDAVITYYHGS